MEEIFDFSLNTFFLGWSELIRTNIDEDFPTHLVWIEGFRL